MVCGCSSTVSGGRAKFAGWGRTRGCGGHGGGSHRGGLRGVLRVPERQLRHQQPEFPEVLQPPGRLPAVPVLAEGVPCPGRRGARGQGGRTLGRRAGGLAEGTRSPFPVAERAHLPGPHGVLERLLRHQQLRAADVLHGQDHLPAVRAVVQGEAKGRGAGGGHLLALTAAPSPTGTTARTTAPSPTGTIARTMASAAASAASSRTRSTPTAASPGAASWSSACPG